jgi:hypothetical protein
MKTTRFDKAVAMLALLAASTFGQHNAATAASDRDDASVSSDEAPRKPVPAADKSKQAAPAREPAGGAPVSAPQSTAGESCGKPQAVPRGAVTTFPGVVCLYATQADKSVRFETLLWRTPVQVDTPSTGAEQPAGATTKQKKSAGDAKKGTVDTKKTTAGAKEPPQELKLRLRRLDLVDAQAKHRIPGDLATGQTELTAIAVPLPGRDAPVRVTLKVPLENVKSGRYSGYVLAESEQSGNGAKPAFLMPVELQLRDAPWCALGILIVGLIVSLWLQFYRERKLKRDELYTRAARAEELALADPALARPGGDAEPFRRLFAQRLRNAVAAIGKADVTTAESELGAGDTLWQKWSADRPTWVAGLRAVKQASKAVQQSSDALSANPGRHAGSLLDALKNQYEKAPEQENATAFRADAETLGRRAARYVAFRRELDSVRARVARISDMQHRTELLAELDALQQQWEDVEDAGASDVDQLRSALTKSLGEIAADAGVPPEPPRPRETMVSEDPPDELDDYLIPRRFRSQVVNARRAREVYGIIVACVVFVGLIVIGFQQTYLSDPAFGANRLADYLKVVAWALGADIASRASLLAFRGNWPTWGRAAAALTDAAAAPGTPPREVAMARRLPL